MMMKTPQFSQNKPTITRYAEQNFGYQNLLLQEINKYKAFKAFNNFDMMAQSVENLKSDIKMRCLSRGNKTSITRVEKILEWYYTKLPKLCTKKTSGGTEYQISHKVGLRIIHNLNVAYELLIEQINILDLLR